MKHYENFAVPVGSIITSFLNWDAFQKHVGIAGWSTKSEWAPCDGRTIDTSTYSGLSGIKTAPDMRGLFLRGFNVIDPHENPVVPALQKNPDEPAMGVAQAEDFFHHTHDSLSGSGFVAGGGTTIMLGMMQVLTFIRKRLQPAGSKPVQKTCLYFITSRSINY